MCSTPALSARLMEIDEMRKRTVSTRSHSIFRSNNEGISEWMTSCERLMSMEVMLIRWVLLARLCRHYRRLLIKQSLPPPSNHFVYLSNTELTPGGSPPHSLLMSDDSSSRGFGLAFNYLAAAEGMSQLLKYVTCSNARALTTDDRLN